MKRAEAFKQIRSVMNPVAVMATLGLQIYAGSALAQSAMITPAQVTPEPNAVISAQRVRAQSLFKALTSVALPIDDARLKMMETLFNSGRDREAAAVATADPLFYDIKVRDIARKMSVREEAVRIPTNDFVATFVGIVRDSDTTPAKQMLTGNFVYRADPNLAGDVPAGEQDVLTSNNHYEMIDSKGYSLMKVLKRVDGQQVMLVAGNGNTNTTTGAAGAHPDPAGLLTTRQWTAAHAIGGTNRRMIEFTFREFMCKPISEFADLDGPEDKIGRDVDRAPGGDHNKYLTTCKGCHSQQDPLRGAFSRIDYNAGQGQPLYFSRVGAKYSSNATNFPQGYTTTDSSWRNNVTAPKNLDAFGWNLNQPMSGAGIGSFGNMIASSKGFSRCMVRRVFNAVCKRDATPKDESLLRKMADDFETDSYHMRRLFQTVALRPECLGNI